MEDLTVKEIFCKLCKKITKHIDIGFNTPLWKCMSCGEYNHEQPKKEN